MSVIFIVQLNSPSSFIIFNKIKSVYTSNEQEQTQNRKESLMGFVNGKIRSFFLLNLPLLKKIW